MSPDQSASRKRSCDDSTGRSLKNGVPRTTSVKLPKGLTSDEWIALLATTGDYSYGRFRDQGPSVRDGDNSSGTRSWLAAAEFSRISVPVSAGSAGLCEGNALQCVGTGKPICSNVSIRKKPRSEYA